jgi:hypothetical protein
MFTNVATFKNATFTGNTIFSKAVFRGATYFSGATMPRTRPTRLKIGTDFANAQFSLPAPPEVNQFFSSPDEEIGEDTK